MIYDKVPSSVFLIKTWVYVELLYQLSDIEK